MGRLARGFAACVIIVLSATLGLPAETTPVLQSVAQDKDHVAAEFARQIAYCTARHDTDYPAFHGCIDWHSAVHGVWALLAYERATGDHRYAALVAAALGDRESLRKEREHLRRAPSFEMPYGRSWFLRLAIEHQALTGSTDLAEMADEVAMSLRDHYRAEAIDRLSRSYDSASWALINLIDYARMRHLGDLQAEVGGWVTKYFLSVEPRCDYDVEAGNFMAVCTPWAALVARVLDHVAYAAWLDRFIAASGLPRPVVPVTAHDFGRNFSRAWGLWDMYAKSGRADVAEAYVEHFKSGLWPPSNWRGEYPVVGHWVSQFGMFALQPLFGADKGR